GPTPRRSRGLERFSRLWMSRRPKWPSVAVPSDAFPDSETQDLAGDDEKEGGEGGQAGGEIGVVGDSDEGQAEKPWSDSASKYDPPVRRPRSGHHHGDASDPEQQRCARGLPRGRRDGRDQGRREAG